MTPQETARARASFDVLIAAKTADGFPVSVIRAPVVDAGPDQAIKPKGDAKLAGRVIDDGLGDPQRGTISATWTWRTQRGKGTVTFEDAGALDTMASFTQP